MKNKILKIVTFIMCAMYVLSILCINSNTNIPLYTGIASGLYLVLFTVANKERYIR